MKKIYLLALMPLLLLLGCQKPSEQRPKKAIMILIDGVPADVIERVNTPNIDEIASLGGYTRAYQGGIASEYSQTPTISAPGYMNMITGVWGNKHNVWGNSVRNPNYNYWNAFRVVEEIAPEKQTAIFSTWLDNRTKLIGEGKPSAGGITLDYAFDGFELDTVAFPHLPDRKFILDIDEHVSTEAARYVKAKAPDLSWVYLEFTDDMGHSFGDSPQMDEAVQLADAQIGKVWKAIKAREETANEDWMLVITTDHGRTASDGKGHGGQSERERTTWMVTNQSSLNKAFTGAAVTSIMPSVLAHIGVQLPDDLRAEIDGVSFINEVSVQDAKATLDNGALTINWTALETNGELEVLYATSNNFAKGGKDEYHSLGKVAVKTGTFETHIKTQADTVKILLKAPNNWTNTWAIAK